MAAKPLGNYQATVVAAKTLADLIGTTVPLLCDHAIIQTQDQAARWKDDGVAPTAALGNLLAVGATVTITRGQFATFKIIEAASAAKVNVGLYQTG